MKTAIFIALLLWGFRASAAEKPEGDRLTNLFVGLEAAAGRKMLDSIGEKQYREGPRVELAKDGSVAQQEFGKVFVGWRIAEDVLINFIVDDRDKVKKIVMCDDRKLRENKESYADSLKFPTSVVMVEGKIKLFDGVVFDRAAWK